MPVDVGKELGLIHLSELRHSAFCPCLVSFLADSADHVRSHVKKPSDEELTLERTVKHTHKITRPRVKTDFNTKGHTFCLFL